MTKATKAKHKQPPRNVGTPLAVAATIIVVVFGGMGAWSATAPIDSAVVAPGVIAVESERRSIQHLEGGIVSEIFVRDGSAVREGQVLLKLDDTRIRAQDEVIRGERYAQLAIEARLLAERDDRPDIVFPDVLMERRADKKIQEIIALQQSQFNARRTATRGQRQILEQRVQQLEEQIVGLVALQQSKRKQGSLIQDEINMIDGLVKAGHVTRQRLLALQREASRLDGEAADHGASIAKARQQIGETQLQIMQLDNERQQDIAKDLRDAQGKLFESEEKLNMTEDQTRRLEVVAPVSGVVMNLAYVTVGGVVPPGATILTIVPSNDKLIVQAQISPSDVDTVYPGQTVHIRFITAAAKQVPVVEGTLETISADRVISEQKPGTTSSSTPAVVPNAFYSGRISVAQKDLETLSTMKLHAGMPVEVLINRGQRTLFEYVMAPLSNRFARAFKEN
jgi:HlyD family type I secretion membrane fusion protein